MSEIKTKKPEQGRIRKNMLKRMVLMLIAVGLLFGGIFGYHAYD